MSDKYMKENMTITKTLDELLSCQDEHFINSVFLSLFRRLPDPVALDRYLGLLRTGEAKIEIIDHLLDSDEAREKGIDLSYILSAGKMRKTMTAASMFAELLSCRDEQFVRCAYLLLYGREPDEEGFSNYLRQLRNGKGKIQILDVLLDSLEARLSGIEHTAMRHSIDLVKNIAAINTIDRLLAVSDENFVACAYLVLLGREPDPESMRYYAGELRAGCGKVEIVVQLAESAEARAYGAKLAGLRQLVALQKKAGHWLWKIFSRGNRMEQQVHRLESEVARLSQQVQQLQLQNEAQISQLLAAVSTIQDLQISMALPSAREREIYNDLTVAKR